jgi:hypothetical protein
VELVDGSFTKEELVGSNHIHAVNVDWKRRRKRKKI